MSSDDVTKHDKKGRRHRTKQTARNGSKISGHCFEPQHLSRACVHACVESVTVLGWYNAAAIPSISKLVLKVGLELAG